MGFYNFRSYFQVYGNEASIVEKIISFGQATTEQKIMEIIRKVTTVLPDCGAEIISGTCIQNRFRFTMQCTTSQYTSTKFENYLNTLPIRHSYSKKGYPYDNAPMESSRSCLKRKMKE